MPAAEVDIDAALVAQLVQDQFADLAAPVRVLANGWDNVVLRLGDDLVVRMPRRAAAVPLVENEFRWLPLLAPRLAVPISAPLHLGRPGRGYPWPWTIAPWIPGVPLAELDVPDRRGVAVDLARAHTALHRPAPPEAPVNPVRGGPLRGRLAAFEERLDSGAVGHEVLLRGVLADALEAARFDGPPVWIHGDPHPANVLVTGGTPARLAALIDFGDVGCGDPATDLAIAWTAFDEPARAAYRAELRPDDGLWRRARGWAAILAAALAANSDDHPGHAATAAHTITQLAVA